jgi:hypothetical protein
MLKNWKMFENQSENNEDKKFIEAYELGVIDMAVKSDYDLDDVVLEEMSADALYFFKNSEKSKKDNHYQSRLPFTKDDEDWNEYAAKP